MGGGRFMEKAGWWKAERKARRFLEIMSWGLFRKRRGSTRPSKRIHSSQRSAASGAARRWRSRREDGGTRTGRRAPDRAPPPPAGTPPPWHRPLPRRGGVSCLGFLHAGIKLERFNKYCSRFGRAALRCGRANNVFLSCPCKALWTTARTEPGPPEMRLYFLLICSSPRRCCPENNSIAGHQAMTGGGRGDARPAIRESGCKLGLEKGGGMWWNGGR